jgi:hypothetical protein
MAVVDHWIEESRISLPVSSYAEFQLSFAQIAALSADEQAELADGIQEIAGIARQADISLTIWHYTAASRPTASGPELCPGHPRADPSQPR